MLSCDHFRDIERNYAIAQQIVLLSKRSLFPEA
jgi:hypothetical protein